MHRPTSRHDLHNHATAECVRGELETIGNLVKIWRLRGESNYHLAHRIALELQVSIIEREDLLKILLSLQRHPTCQPHRDTHA